MAFSAAWTTHGISYAAETHEGYLMWGSAPAGLRAPLTMKRVEPADFLVLSKVKHDKEIVVTARVRGKRVTVFLPDPVFEALELAWKHVNVPS